jgi:pheromone alpha factor receptor
MASSNTSGAPGPLLRPEEQLVVLLGPTGSDNITVPLSEVDIVWSLGASGAISYGSQVGACFMMLIVLLGMTPGHRFKRAPTIVHMLALIFNMIRMLLLALYFPSTWYDLYTQMTGDVQFVAQMDYNISIAATILGLPVTILIEAALILQAWSMIQLWERRFKIPTTIVSVLLVLTTIAFNILNVVVQTNFILHGTRRQLWMRMTFLSLVCTSITWFCFLFNSRLVIHMWQNRTILPSLKGLHAMDVLVITNGFLMIIPGM